MLIRELYAYDNGQEQIEFRRGGRATGMSGTSGGGDGL